MHLHPLVIQALALGFGLLLLWGGNALVNKHHDRSLQKLRVYRP